MRLFIAIPLPKEVKDYLYDLEKELVKLPAKFSLVSKKNLHITLKFIPNASESQLEELKARLSKIKFDSFKISLIDKGIFPNSRNPRVIWVGLDSDDLLRKLQQEIDEKLLDLFSGSQEFTSHITLGRIKSIKNKETFDNELKKISVESLKFNIDEFGLFKSTLTKEGPIYTLIEKYKLD
ncbi:MAG: RNA 2',3'-cyclic phosphodiesterase [Candidatus Nanoarchaeia archaeon]|nr:RNA 2',3'-cyclic phosphodiesterase [Candidatus Nanoarchaeia archaeon]